MPRCVLNEETYKSIDIKYAAVCVFYFEYSILNIFGPFFFGRTRLPKYIYRDLCSQMKGKKQGRKIWTDNSRRPKC